ncbi:nuclear transport factor 2 family protein [Candidatus Thorarchaeota archaeon]|nr:MAG: nuclear transport factor 2 family protein [Candidatus Thorarchaeota archaeon]
MYVIYLRGGSIVLSKVRYIDWQAIQDDYNNYMTSFGPWDVGDILSYFEDEYKEESTWVFTSGQIRTFMESGEFILHENNLRLTDLKSKSATAIQFNNYINSHDIEGLSSLMTHDHTFIDSENDVHEGKKVMTEGWRIFFRSYPDYTNIFQQVEMRNGMVVMIGYSTCSNEPVLDGPAMWSAKLCDGKLSEWRVYLDTPENRSILGIEKINHF